MLEYDLSIVEEPIRIASRPQIGAMIVNPGNTKRKGNPNPNKF